MKETKLTNVRLDIEMIAIIKTIVSKDNKYSSMSHFWRMALQNLIDKEK